jgi:tetratricopeptide (TPR) repeat protein
MAQRPSPTPGDDEDGSALRALARAIDLQQHGRLDEAEREYASLLSRNGRDPTVLVNAGALALARGDVDASIARLSTAVSVAPANAVAHGNLGFALIHARRYADALAALDRAIGLKQDFAQAHNNRGIALLRLRQRPQAREAFASALQILPAYAEAALNLGEMENQDANADRARDAFERVLARDPDHVLAKVGVAFADSLEGRLPQAQAALQAIVARHPGIAPAWQTLAAVSNWAGRYEDAERAYRHVLSIDAAHREARFGLASTLLSRGRYEEGFAAFEHSRAAFTPAHAQVRALPAWKGETLDGTLVLHGEQGLGDVVQFARFVPRLRDRVKHLVLWLDDYWKPLAPLFATLNGIDDVIVDDEIAQRPAKARASVLSLAHIARATPATLWDGPYLAATRDRMASWRSRVDASARLRVGVAWSVHARDDFGLVTKHKSIPAASLAPLLDIADVAFHSLQPGADGDTAAFAGLAGSVAPTGATISDFGDTAALIANLDLVITPDTAVAHVAGALGKPVWLLERFHGCWRWRLAPQSSPWYPTMRIFRQARFNDWSDVVERVGAELAAAVRTYREADRPR